MNLEIRQLTRQSEFDACIALQHEIWGLEPLGQTSPITLKALSIADPAVGLMLGAFDKNRMAGFAIALGTLKPGVAYFHMLGVLEEYRDLKVGKRLYSALQDAVRAKGAREAVFTYEPLESRNANLYIGLQGARAVAYQEDCYQVETTMHEGLPMDRFVAVLDLTPSSARQPSLSLAQALDRFPVADPGQMPEADAVLVEIPGDLAGLKRQDMSRARRFRHDTRLVFTEYLNHRQYTASGFFSEATGRARKSFYLLTAPEG